MSEVNYEEAKKVRRRYNRRLDNLRHKSTTGDNQASIQMLQQIVEKADALAALGYRETSESEPGRLARLVLITKEWQDEQEKKMEQREKLLQAMEEARSAGDSKEFFKLLHQVAGIE